MRSRFVLFLILFVVIVMILSEEKNSAQSIPFHENAAMMPVEADVTPREVIDEKDGDGLVADDISPSGDPLAPPEFHPNRPPTPTPTVSKPAPTIVALPPLPNLPPQPTLIPILPKAFSTVNVPVAVNVPVLETPIATKSHPVSTPAR